jgi:hemoglobin
VKRFSGVLVAAALGTAALARAGDSDTLFVHLGAAAGVEAIAGELIDRVAGDPVLGRSFKDSNLKRIKLHLTEQLCELSGGPCHYGGDPMREVHAGHAITEAEFYGMVEALRGILKARGVALADRNRLLELLAPLKRDVVRVPAGS